MRRTKFFILGAALLMASACGRDTAESRLYEGFVNPPQDARPQVWWHWMHGNISRDGIRKDLEWMHEAGLGGFHLFDGAYSTPLIVDHRVEYMTPEWQDMLEYAVRLADSLGLEMTIASSPGWSESGGPWVAPEDGMKRLTWRELDVTGGSLCELRLPEPYSLPSMYQNMPATELFGTGHGAVRNVEDYGVYHDIAVLAFPLHPDEAALRHNPVKLTTSGGDLTLQALTDGDYQSGGTLKAVPKGQKRFIMYEFERPQTLRSIIYSVDRFSPETAPAQVLQASDDGLNWSDVATLVQWRFPVHTFSFEPVTARFFRVVFANSRDLSDTYVSELRPLAAPRVMRAEENLGFLPWHAPESTPQYSDGIASGSIIDISDRLGPDGVLRWDAPEGEWRVMRFGWALTGKKNYPASPEATGLEVDKMDGAAVERYYGKYIDMYREASGGMLGKRGITWMLNDSYEALGSTWTPALPEEFAQRRGYDLMRWLPVVAGYVLDDTRTTRNFMWDWNNTIGELIVENHYDRLSDILSRYGMRRYSESHESARALCADGMSIKRRADVPMAAMWAGHKLPMSLLVYEADIRESASTAHIYGQKYVAAESFTAESACAYMFYPENLKPTADLELANGLNRFVIHEYTHQPSDAHKPGLSLGGFGQWFNRHEIWADQAHAWMDYLARSSYMLQQGLNHADIALLYPERNNLTYYVRPGYPCIPQGFAYDYVNAEAILKHCTVRGGKLVAPSGATYSILALGDQMDEMSVPLLRRLDEMSAKGLTICGPRPRWTAGLGSDPDEFALLADRIWSRPNVLSDCSVAVSGGLDSALSGLGLKADCLVSCEGDASDFRFVHRVLPQGHVYWISNTRDEAADLSVTVNAAGFKPMLWRAEDASVQEVSYRCADGCTAMPLHLDAHDAVFIVMMERSRAASCSVPAAVCETVLEMNDGWAVTFESPFADEPGFTMQLDSLFDFSQTERDEMRYFSGTVVYRKSFTLATVEDCTYEIDLGRVCFVAEAFLNGKPLGISWHAPFVLPLEGLKAGENEIEVRVCNTWKNRVIGDRRPDVKNPRVFTSFPYYVGGGELMSSGLVGPVTINQIE